jgi:hypothetical protein
MIVLKTDNFEISKEDFLWKYLDFYKFLYFILKNKIYFSRLDQLEDPHEGLSEWIQKDKFYFDSVLSLRELNPAIPFEQRETTINEAKQGLNYIKEVALVTQVSQYVSCWYTSHRESKAMWDIYSNCDSVALRFDAVDLIKIITEAAENNSDKHYNYMLLGNVTYEDLYPPDPINFDTQKTSSVTLKDTCYAHEQEFRFVINRTKPEPRDIGFHLVIPLLTSLKFNIITHPKMAQWKFDLLYQLLEKFDLHHRISKSVIPNGKLL